MAGRVRVLFFMVLQLFAFSFLQAQNATTNYGKDPLDAGTTIKDTRKVLVIPFDPKMYMSEIDHLINRETKLTFNEIRHTFRVGLDFNVYTAFKKTFPASSLLMDTLKTKKDLEQVYKTVGYKYDPVPEDGKKVKSDDYNKDSKIQGGQIMVKVDNSERFMNATLKNKILLNDLNQKYGADFFVFINELDIKMLAAPNAGVTVNHERTIAVHYTVMDKEGNVIAAGLATEKCPADKNIPKQIILDHIAKISDMIYEKTLIALGLKELPPAEKKKAK